MCSSARSAKRTSRARRLIARARTFIVSPLAEAGATARLGTALCTASRRNRGYNADTHAKKGASSRNFTKLRVPFKSEDEPLSRRPTSCASTGRSPGVFAFDRATERRWVAVTRVHLLRADGVCTCVYTYTHMHAQRPMIRRRDFPRNSLSPASDALSRPVLRQ